MTSHTKDHETQGMDCRDFLRTSAAGIAAAGAVAAGLATTAASATSTSWLRDPVWLLRLTTVLSCSSGICRITSRTTS